MKKLKPVVHREDGTTVCYPDADLANSDWLASRRLLVEGKKKELAKKFNTPMYTRD